MKYLEIRNWHEFQHYKDRTPPWIKLHFNLLTSHDWVMASDATKLTMLICMMVGSRNEGKVPLDPEYIRRAANLAKQPDLKPLIECGFFGDASVGLADASTKAQADAIIEKRREEERRGDAPAPHKMPFQEIPSEWTKFCSQDLGWPSGAIADTFTEFQDYWQSGKGKSTKRLEWAATWRNWCRKQRIQGIKPQPVKKAGGVVV